MRSVFFRAHEWLADRCTWVQYPQVKRLGQTRPSLWRQYQLLTRKQRGWFWFVVVWGAIFSLIRLTA